MEISGVRLVVLFDSPHLDKGDRNNLLTKDLETNFQAAEKDPTIPREFVEWKHFDKAYEMDVGSDKMYRNIPKVTRHHVKIGRIRKMKVLFSRQVLSRSMAAWLETTTKFDGNYLFSEFTLNYYNFNSEIYLK